MIRSLRAIERDALIETMAHFSGSTLTRTETKRAAAAALGISMKTLYDKLHRHGMEEYIGPNGSCPYCRLAGGHGGTGCPTRAA